LVGFHNGAIDARRETEIVSVDDQAAHRASLAGMSVMTLPAGGQWPPLPQPPGRRRYENRIGSCLGWSSALALHQNSAFYRGFSR